MTYDIISYILIGSLFLSLAVPVIALLVKSFREQKQLDEVEAGKKPKATISRKEDMYSMVD